MSWPYVFVLRYLTPVSQIIETCAFADPKAEVRSMASLSPFATAHPVSDASGSIFSIIRRWLRVVQDRAERTVTLSCYRSDFVQTSRGRGLSGARQSRSRSVSRILREPFSDIEQRRAGRRHLPIGITKISRLSRWRPIRA